MSSFNQNYIPLKKKDYHELGLVPNYDKNFEERMIKNIKNNQKKINNISGNLFSRIVNLFR